MKVSKKMSIEVEYFGGSCGQNCKHLKDNGMLNGSYTVCTLFGGMKIWNNKRKEECIKKFGIEKDIDKLVYECKHCNAKYRAKDYLYCCDICGNDLCTQCKNYLPDDFNKYLKDRIKTEAKGRAVANILCDDCETKMINSIIDVISLTSKDNNEENK